jgi:hypothetical protein
MKTNAKKLLITTEKHEVFIMRLGTIETVTGYCEWCQEEVEMLTLDSAVRVSGITGQQIVRQIANNQTHSIETLNGHLLLCRKSLLQSLIENSPGA